MHTLRLILDVDKRDGSQERFWMNLGELLRIGRSSSADICIGNDFDLADHHFSIAGSAEGWQLQAMPGARVGVNGQLAQRCMLSHGDRIIAGETEFHVTIEQPTRLDAVAKPEVAEQFESAQRVKATYKVSVCTSGVTRIEVTLNETLLVELLEQVRRAGQLWCAVNTQQLGNGIAGINPVTEDLFAPAPEEIRASDSLFLAELPLETTVLSKVQKASSADSALLFVSSLPIEELVEQQKLVWAWYARPSIIEQQLRVGSKHMAEKLTAAVETVVLLNRMDCDVVLFTTAAASEDIVARLASL